MNESTLALIIHQLVFQGMFIAKNLLLRRKLGQPIRGNNTEANIAIGFFVVFIGLSLYIAAGSAGPFTVRVVPIALAKFIGYVLMIASVIVALASLWHLGNSWRVGVIEEQQTLLVRDGIYAISRNPYFLAYLLMFAAYTVFLRDALLLLLSIVGFILIHRMVRREEAHLARAHGDDYQQYLREVPRYLSLRKR